MGFLVILFEEEEVAFELFCATVETLQKKIFTDLVEMKVYFYILERLL